MAASSRSLPAGLAFARLIAGPFVAALVLWAHQVEFSGGGIVATRFYGGATLLFILAALTAWLEGAPARLAQAADKILVVAALVALAYAALPVDLVAAAIVLIGCEVLAASSADTTAGGLGKFKTAAATAGVAAFLAYQTWSILSGGDAIANVLVWLARTLLWLASLLALWGIIEEARQAKPNQS